MCGRAWLLVSLFVRSLESTRMECYGDPQFVFSTKIGWKEVFWGPVSLFASTKRRDFHDLVVYFSCFF